MSESINLYIALGCFWVFASLIAYGIYKYITSPKKQKKENDVIEAAAVGGRRNMPGGLRRRMNIRQDDSDSDEADRDFSDNDIDQLNFGKMGKKKTAKMQAKQEKKAHREYELKEREEKKKLALINEERDAEARAKEELAEKDAEEKERIEREEKERKDYEEYLQMKEAFSIEEEGVEELDEDAARNLKQEFIEFIKEVKVINLDELGSKFNLSVSDVSSRLNTFIEDKSISGVIDDRGKFIYITEAEWTSVAQFINNRGRVSLQEIIDSSNCLISLKSNYKADEAISLIEQTI